MLLLSVDERPIGATQWRECLSQVLEVLALRNREAPDVYVVHTQVGHRSILRSSLLVREVAILVTSAGSSSWLTMFSLLELALFSCSFCADAGSAENAR